MEVNVSLDKLNCGKPSAGQELTTLSCPSSSVLKEVATLIQYICTCIIYAKLVAARHMTANSKGSLIKEGHGGRRVKQSQIVLRISEKCPLVWLINMNGRPNCWLSKLQALNMQLRLP